jgi:hypothetical protein
LVSFTTRDIKIKVQELLLRLWLVGCLVLVIIVMVLRIESHLKQVGCVIHVSDYIEVIKEINDDISISLEKKGKAARERAKNEFVPTRWADCIIGE